MLDRLWAEGAGLDDRQAIAAARESATGPIADQLSLWADWVAADDGQSRGVEGDVIDRLADDPAALVLVIAIELRAAVLRRDHEAIDEALVATDRMLGRIATEDPRAAVARAAADIALAETALYGQDLPSARRCLEGLVASGPTALRITALMRSVTLALAGADAATARKRARQALTLAHSTNRPTQAQQAQLLLGIVSYMAGDTDAMRAQLQPLVEAHPDDATTRLVLAGLEGPDRAIATLADGLTRAAQRGDALGYALCALVGARRYVAIGKRADALVTMSSVRMQLGDLAPEVSYLLDAELESWKRAWGDEVFAKAERDAMALLQRDLAGT